VAIAGCAGHIGQSASRRSVDSHAQTAGIVMTRAPYESPSPTAAWTVAGQSGDTEIEALTANGTTWKGTVVLRITVRIDRGPRPEDLTTRCFRYDFNQADANDSRPHALSCPSTPALELASPPPAPDLGTVQAQSLARALEALTASQRLDVSAVNTLLKSRFPAPAVTSAAPLDPDTVSIGVHYADACIIGELPRAGAARLVATHGADCRGG
jgi:hypothetical protein